MERKPNAAEFRVIIILSGENNNKNNNMTTRPAAFLEPKHQKPPGKHKPKNEKYI